MRGRGRPTGAKRLASELAAAEAAAALASGQPVPPPPHASNAAKKRGPGRPRKDERAPRAGKKPIVGSLEDENPHALGKYAVPPGR